ncbi:MAG: glycosyltransferase family 4 protein [Balneolaceae bacterium]
MGKPSDKTIIELEKQNKHPRVSYLEDMLKADLLDERYLYGKTSGLKQWIYKRIPVEIAQVFEAVLLRKKYDVIFSQTERTSLILALVMKYLRINIPHVMVVSRITSMYKNKSKKKMWMLKHGQSKITRILIWSSVQRNIAIQQLGIPPEKIKLLKRGTDQKFWSPIPSPTDTICSVGMEMRDYPTLVEALRPLDIPCHIAVSSVRGELFDTVQRVYEMDKIPDHISVGRKGYIDLRELYARSRFVVVPLLPTDSDNGLTSILEAMAMGKAVICTRSQGQVDVIQEGVTGIFVPQGDPEALRHEITKLWNDPERAAEMGKAARKYVEEHHSLEQFSNSIQREVRNSAGIREFRNGSPIKPVEVNV